MSIQYKLPTNDFLHVIKSTPLVAIDLVIEDINGLILVGYRTNEPAKGYWFVPGGRIFKNELFADALVRLLKEEIGLSSFTGNYECLGVYDHIYDTCFYEKEPSYTNTHYVVIGIKIKLEEPITIRVDEQHSAFAWRTKQELLMMENVHTNTKKYFQEIRKYGTISYA